MLEVSLKSYLRRGQAQTSCIRHRPVPRKSRQTAYKLDSPSQQRGPRTKRQGLECRLEEEGQ